MQGLEAVKLSGQSFQPGKITSLISYDRDSERIFHFLFQGMSGEKYDELDISKKFYVSPVKFLLAFNAGNILNCIFLLHDLYKNMKNFILSGSDSRDLSVSIYSVLSVVETVFLVRKERNKNI